MRLTSVSFIVQQLLSFTVLTIATLSSFDELWKSANQLWKSDDLDSVMIILQQLETLQPGERQVLVGMASVYHRQGEFDKELEVLDIVLTQNPRDPKVLQRIGEIYAEKSEISKALEYLHAAERQLDLMNVEEMDALMHQLALTYHRGKDFAMAEIYFNRILEAGDAYNAALAIDPTQAQARIGIAALHQQFGNVNESIPLYLHVINASSTTANLKIMAMSNIGAAYEVTKDIVSALRWYERALEEISADPGVIYSDQYTAEKSQMHLMVHVTRAKLSACVWEQAEEEFDSLWTMVTSIQGATDTRCMPTPFDSLLHSMSPLDRKWLAVQFSTQYTLGDVATRNNVFSPRPKPHEQKHTKSLTSLNVGYLSYDYAEHPTMHLMEGIFANKDRSSIKVTAFGYGRDDSSEIRKRVIDTVDRFVDLSKASFEESDSRIRDENIHILMDAQGHTYGSRMEIVAARPAPIVVNYLVYPGTS
ncbi:UDP-N-acetylglucosamine-peptide N-acetylglucosaminyltransferase, partial [Phytophthora palmivora]